MTVSTPSTSRRVQELRRRLAGADPKVDAFLVTDANNRRYVSGFTGSAGQLLLSAGDAVLLTDFRYVEQATTQAPEFEVVKTEGQPWPEIVAQAGRRNVKRLGIEAQSMTVDEHLRLLEAAKEPGLEIVPLRGTVEAVRQAKDASELEAIRRAVEVADRSLEAIARELKPGLTEREVAWRLEVAMRERGAEGVSFPIIVASGPNGAMPHHRASDRQIALGEPIVIDMGCRLDGYCSDMTRTLVLGEPDAKFWEIYHIVLRAQQTCEDGLRAGMIGKEADLLARDVIKNAGYGDHFGHGTGHGVGLAIHEDPYLSPTRGEMTLPERAVVTVEPGIYLPGWGGIRIEDMVVVGQSRGLILTTAHKFPVVDV